MRTQRHLAAAGLLLLLAQPAYAQGLVQLVSRGVEAAARVAAAAACHAVGPTDAVLDSIVHSRRLLEDAEQVATFGGPEKQQCGALAMKRELEAIILPWASQLQANGIVPVDLDHDWDHASWKGRDAWLARLGAAAPDQRCRLLNLAYMSAIYRLDTIPASVEIRKMKDMRIRDSHGKVLIDDSALALDRARASFELRYLHSVPSGLVPAACNEIAVESAKRWSFIFESDRRPLGIAIGMCGRPLAAHYLDDEVDRDQRPHPEGWSTKSRSTCGE